MNAYYSKVDRSTSVNYIKEYLLLKGLILFVLGGLLFVVSRLHKPVLKYLV